MRNRELSRQIQQLNALITRTDQASAGDVEMQSHWAKYICVLSAGLLENALPELYAEYAQGSASPAIALYVRTSVSKIRKPQGSLKRRVPSRKNGKKNLGLLLTMRGAKMR